MTTMTTTRWRWWCLAVAVVSGCSPDYPECGAHAADEGGAQTEQGPEGPHTPETDPPAVPEPWPGGEGLAEGDGYRRTSSGEVCTCSLAEPGCSAEEPGAGVSVSGDGVCDVRAPEGDADCGASWTYKDLDNDTDGLYPFRCDFTLHRGVDQVKTAWKFMMADDEQEAGWKLGRWVERHHKGWQLGDFTCVQK
jgi:hypothetical protein